MQSEPYAREGAKPKPGALVKTATPGIYRKVGAKAKPYVVVYRAAGKQRKEACRTLDEARKLKAARNADVARGEFQTPTKITLREFLTEWIDRYTGNGKRGFRENTREEYRRLLNRYAHRYFGERLRLMDVTPHHLARFVGWVADESKQGKRLSDSSIANVLVPVRAALGTAQREGLIRHNPSQGLALPASDRIEEDEDEDVRALSRDQLRTLLDLTPMRYRVLFELIASTGLRISEAIALQRRHLKLDGGSPHLLVRRAIVRGRIEPPKSKYGRRTVPLPQALVFKLRAHVAELDQSPDALVFPNMRGRVLDPDNLRARTFKPLAEEVGAPWAAFHSLRHTFASLQLARGVNVLQLSRALGHHSPAFTLSVYTHLLPGDEAPALDLAEELEKPAEQDALAAAA